MGQGTEPADSGGAIAVPPELREALNAALAAGERSATDDDPAALNALLDAWAAVTQQEGFGAAPPDFQAAVFNSWGHALEQRYEVGGAPTDLEAAIAAFDAAVATAPAASPSRTGYLGNLGNSTLARYTQTGDAGDLDTAVAAFEAAVAATPGDSPYRPRYLTNLGTVLRYRYDARAVPADLDASIVAYQAAVDVAPADDPDLLAMLNNLENGLRERYDRSWASTDLDAIITGWQRALDVAPADDPNRSAILGNLGIGLRDRYDRTAALADLDAVITAYQQAVDSSDADDPDRPRYLRALGAGLHERYRRAGPTADLDGAITAYRQAVDVTPADDPGRPMSLTILGNCLEDRYGRTGAPADLEAAITTYQQAVDASAADAPDRPGFLSNLGRGLRDRYGRTGSPADLEAAVTAWRQAVDTSPAGATNRPMYLNNLGGGLRDRYDHSGLLADLEEVIRACREALDTTPADYPDRPAMLSNLGTVLQERFGRMGSPADLEEAITVSREALEATPADSPDQPIYLTTLGSGLRTRYLRTGDAGDLEAAITAHRQALDAIPPGAPERPIYLRNLGGSLRNRFARTGAPADLDAAIAAFQEALDTTTTDAPSRPGHLVYLGSGLRDRYDRSGSASDLDAAIAAYREACHLGLTIAPAVTLASAKAWGVWAIKREAWAEAAEGYGDGLAATDHLYRTQLLPGAKQTWLGDAQGLAAGAAYALARTGDPAAAFLALERGRARLLTEAIQRDRADLADVKALDPGAYAAYELAAGRLRRLESQERASGTSRPDAAHAVPADLLQEQARQARADLEAAIGRIQPLPGHATFGQLPTIDEVARVAEPGCPVVALVTTAAGSLGLLVSRVDDSAAPIFEAIWAPELTSQVLNDLLVVTRDGQVVGGYLAGQLGEPDWLEDALADDLPVVGTSLIGPIAARLRELNSTGVVLLPTGLLGLLPLHAAPYPVVGETRCLLDEFDVSHTPGALVLRSARAALAAREEQPAVLVGVGNPQPHPQPLAFARAELEEVARFFPDGASHALYETASTETALVGLLPKATHVHLACHGRFDADNPLDSCLELARPEASEPAGDEGRVRLEEILANDWFGHSRLVVLSACQTAIIDARRLPDEAIGLPAGLLQAGVPGVIGTLWSVDDLSTTLLMTQFYAYHRQGDAQTGEGPLSPAAALRRAQGWLRTRTADDLVTLLAAHRSMAAADQQRRGMRMSAAEAGAGLRQLGLEEPTSRPFADPYYWAPFVAIGA